MTSAGARDDGDGAGGPDGNHPKEPDRSWRDRLVGLRRTRADAYRVYAIVFIIWAHCEASLGPLPGTVFGLLHQAFNVVGHAAIPFFFFIAGNHLGPKLAEHPGFATVRPYVRRIGGLFLVWSLVYFVHGAFAATTRPDMPGMFVRHAAALMANPLSLALRGTSLHLWFLVALVFAAILSAVVLQRMRLRGLILVGLGLYLVALLAGAYGTALGSGRTDRLGVAGILQGPLFFAVGLVLSRRRVRLSARVGWALAAGGAGLHGAELVVLARAGLDPLQTGMLLGTIPLSAGIGVLSLQPRPSSVDRLVAHASALVPVAYLSHVAFLDVLRPHARVLGPVGGRVALAAGVVACAFATASILRRIDRRWRWLRRAIRARRLGAPPV